MGREVMQVVGNFVDILVPKTKKPKHGFVALTDC